MTKVLCFSHRGLRAVIPENQATQVDVSPPAEQPLVQLWRGSDVDEPRWLCAEVRSGSMWVRCTDVRLEDVAPSRMLGLSQVLRHVLQSLPHVVGAVQMDSGYAWLVDLSRLADGVD